MHRFSVPAQDVISRFDRLAPDPKPPPEIVSAQWNFHTTTQAAPTRLSRVEQEHETIEISTLG